MIGMWLRMWLRMWPTSKPLSPSDLKLSADVEEVDDEDKDFFGDFLVIEDIKSFLQGESYPLFI